MNNHLLELLNFALQHPRCDMVSLPPLVDDRIGVSWRSTHEIPEARVTAPDLRTQRSKPTAWHSPDETPSENFHGPLCGTRVELAKAIFNANDQRGRQLTKRLESHPERFWGREFTRPNYGVWFAREDEFLAAGERLAELRRRRDILDASFAT